MCFVSAILLLAASTLLGASKAEAQRLFKEGQKAERQHQVVRAYLLYTQALTQDPYNREYWAKSQALRVQATLVSQQTLPMPGVEGLNRPAAPTPPASLPLAQPPIELAASTQRVDIDMKGDARALFSQIAQLFKLEASFDIDYPPGAPLHFQLRDSGYREALQALEAATGSFVVPRTQRVILVARDTPQKRLELEPFVTVAIPIPTTLTTQDAQELMRGVQQAVGATAAITLDTQHGIIVMRDRVSKVRPAQALIQQLLQHRAMVSIQVEFLERAQSLSTRYGVSPQTLFPFVNFGSIWNSKPNIPAGFTDFLVFGGGRTFLGVGIASLQAVARMSESSGRTLFHTEIRSLDGQQATVHVGDKYPIVTSRFLSSSATDQLSIPPSITFQDLGLVIDVTPRVHGDEVSLKLDTEFKALTGQVVDENPVISNRKLQSDVRLRSGEWAVVAGLINSSQARTITGLAGLSRVPLLGPLFSQRGLDQSDNDILIVIKPVVLGLPPSAGETRPIALGAEQRPRSAL